MPVLDLAYIFGGLITMFLFLFKRGLLNSEQKEDYVIIWAVAILLFVTAIIVHFTAAGRDSASGALLTPVMSLGVYQLLRRGFRKTFHREAQDKLLVLSGIKAEDRAFDLVFVLTTIFLMGFNIIALLELAKRGW